MPDYGHAAEEIKEMIIQDYLKKHPELSRHDVITKTVNGRVICETINKTLNKLSGRNHSKILSQKEKTLLKKLREGQDDRYASSIDSISTCRNYINWLQNSKIAEFDDQQAKEHIHFLDSKEQEAGKYAIDLLMIRRKFTNAIGSKVKPSQSLIKTLMIEYTEAAMNQFKVQSAIYGKEIDLSDLFKDSVQNFLQAHFDHFADMEESVLLAIGKACQMLNGADLSKVHVAGNEEPDQIKKALANFNKRIDKLRREFEMIQKLINYLEKMLNDLGKIDNDSVEPDREKSQAAYQNRMAFTSKRQRKT